MNVKVYIVEAMSREGYSGHSWVVKVFDSEEKACEYINQNASEDSIHMITVRELE